MRYPRGYVPDHAKFALRIDEYSSAEDETPSGSERYMTTPEPGAPEPGLGPAAAGSGASCGGGFGAGGGQGTSGYGVGMGSSDTANGGEDEDMSFSDNSDQGEDGDSNITPSDTAEENGRDQHEGNTGSVAGGQTSVMEIDSNDEDMEIYEKYEKQGTHTKLVNVERWLKGTYAVGYGSPRNAQKEMEYCDRGFGA